MGKLEELEKEARRIVLGVSDDPIGRYKLRYRFYQRYGYPVVKGKEGLGNSELAFMKWEIRRGVLNPLGCEHPGSPWWREVNSRFLYLSTLADLIQQSGQQFSDLPLPVNFWLEYIKAPNEMTWYEAHNSSIISGYSVANDLAFEENVYEQYFMNIVLYRLFFAQSMVEGVSFGLLGKILANPRGGAVSIVTDIESFYPKHYPLTKQDIKYVTHRAHNLPGILEWLFDKILILPGLNKLYMQAANWNSAPEVLEYVKNNKPVYPVISPATAKKVHFTRELETAELPVPA